MNTVRFLSAARTALLLFMGASSILCPSAFAQEQFDKVLKSKELRISKGRKNQWLVEDTNYAKVFAKNGDGVVLLTKWIGTVGEEFRAEDPEHVLQEDLAIARRRYVIRDNRRKIEVMIIIPSKLIRLAAENGFVPRMAQYLPPALKPIEENQVAIGDTTGRLFFHSKGSCSLVIPTTQSGMVRLSVDKCEDNQYMIALARKLEIERLSAKLLY